MSEEQRKASVAGVSGAEARVSRHHVAWDLPCRPYKGLGFHCEWGGAPGGLWAEVLSEALGPKRRQVSSREHPCVHREEGETWLDSRRTAR